MVPYLIGSRHIAHPPNWKQLEPQLVSHKLRKMFLLIAGWLSPFSSFLILGPVYLILAFVPRLLIIKIAFRRCYCGLFVYSNEHLMANSKLVTHTHTHTKEKQGKARKIKKGREIQIGLTCSNFPIRFLHFTLFPRSPPNMIFITLSQFITVSVFFFFLTRFSFINYGEILQIVRLLFPTRFAGKSPHFMAHPLYLSLWELRIICAC